MFLLNVDCLWPTVMISIKAKMNAISKPKFTVIFGVCHRLFLVRILRTDSFVLGRNSGQLSINIILVFHIRNVKILEIQNRRNLQDFNYLWSFFTLSTKWETASYSDLEQSNVITLFFSISEVNYHFVDYVQMSWKLYTLCQCFRFRVSRFLHFLI